MCSCHVVPQGPCGANRRREPQNAGPPPTCNLDSKAVKALVRHRPCRPLLAGKPRRSGGSGQSPCPARVLRPERSACSLSWAGGTRSRAAKGIPVRGAAGVLDKAGSTAPGGVVTRNVALSLHPGLADPLQEPGQDRAEGAGEACRARLGDPGRLSSRGHPGESRKRWKEGVGSHP